MATKTLCDLDSTQTLTNKTLTTPVITGGNAGTVLFARESAVTSFVSPLVIVYCTAFMNP